MSTSQPKSGPNGQPTPPSKALDRTDWRILEELQADARISYAELGRRVGLSSPAVQERVRKLEDAGIITGYQAVVNPRRVGYPILAIIRFSSPRDEQKLRRELERTPYIIDCYGVLGTDAYIAKVAAPDVEELGRVADELQSVAATTTAVVTLIVEENAPITSNFGEVKPGRS
ncbi:Lrp/AsnC family transcriptional regulator [Phototrophicus methaneseepsis]|uniref:Lrp/AsnC family transcriptional regulator n=1 Tax=Phototrophicus methaneseepsis TaxID=2710758 RepID=A0A7S8E8T4_9CHLR|nr:Lrp/AsnC family transcriptional regulator [Phototrophicus methaneseepsis]QPC82481.1 Lrp/AsnC family transcriptional regulator [Phototrophicus methaneseepsis]